MINIPGTDFKVDEKYTPPKTIYSNSDKTIWTERKLKKLQANLFRMFRECRRMVEKEGHPLDHPCQDCKDKKCEEIVNDMVKYLLPYGISIYKGSFKWRSTLEEFDRVVRESITSLIIDIWVKQKKIHSSFGRMLKWKMVYFLDGKINLFDSDKFCSLDQIQDSFPNSGGNNGEDLIEFYSDSLKDAVVLKEAIHEVHAKHSVQFIIDIVEGSIDFYEKFTSAKEKYAMYLRSLLAFNRFMQNKDNFIIFRKKPRARFYFQKLVDSVYSYMKETEKHK